MGRRKKLAQAFATIMEDARFEWLRERVYHGLKLNDAQIFERLLDDDKNDDLIRKFILDTATDETAFAILFYLDRIEKTRDIEVENDNESAVNDMAQSDKMSVTSSARSGSKRKGSQPNSQRNSRHSLTPEGANEEEVDEGGANEGGDTEETQPQPKKKIIIEKRIETESYIDTVLHVIERRLPEEKENVP